jgi:hypothetical protein
MMTVYNYGDKRSDIFLKSEGETGEESGVFPRAAGKHHFLFSAFRGVSTGFSGMRSETSKEVRGISGFSSYPQG